MLEQDDPLPTKAYPEIGDMLAAADGLPLPPVVKRNLWKSACRLIASLTDLASAGIDYPTALIEAKTDQVRATAAARRAVKSEMAKRVPEMIAADPELSDRATIFLGREMLIEQSNRERTINHAMDDLSSAPPDSDTEKEIDDDWLHAFTKEASTKSAPEMQTYFGKILSGEIKRPGTFSIKTVRALGMMSRTTANQFQTLCNVSVHVLNFSKVISLSGNAGSNALQKYGLYFDVLSNLNSEGLIYGDFHTHHDLMTLYIGVSDYAGTPIFLKGSGAPQKNVKIHGPTFTTIGMELRMIVSMRPNPIYTPDFIKYLSSTGGLALYKALGKADNGRIIGHLWKE